MSKEEKKDSKQPKQVKGVAFSGFLTAKPSKKKTNKGKRYKKPLSFPELSFDDVVRKVLNTPPPK